MRQLYGTAYYIAPEVIQGSYTERCDLWSIGVMLFIMLSGKPPFTGRTDREILAKVKLGKYSMMDASWKKISSEAQDLVKRLMSMDPDDRGSAAEAIQHPWIQKKVKTGAINTELALDSMANLKNFKVSDPSNSS